VIKHPVSNHSEHPQSMFSHDSEKPHFTAKRKEEKTGKKEIKEKRKLNTLILSGSEVGHRK
jgi:hypothetical protein